MTPATTSDDSTLLLHAYLDGELDPANALAIERRIAAEPAFAAEYERLEALQKLVRERLARSEASAARLAFPHRGLHRRETAAQPADAAFLAPARRIDRDHGDGCQRRDLDRARDRSRKTRSATPSSPRTSGR